MNYKKHVERLFYIFIIVFSLINIFMLKNFMQNSIYSTENISHNVTFSLRQNLIISLEEINSKEKSVHCQLYDSTNTILNFSSQELILKYSNLENKCKNFLSDNGVKHAEWVTIEYDLAKRFSYFRYNYKYLLENKIKIKNCQYSTITWYKSDYEYKLSPEIFISNGSRILKENEEFFYIKCISSSNLKYETVYARILSKIPPKQVKSRQPINVFMLGLDSVSRKLWLDSLPMSSHYLIKSLKANVLSSYNIVGDGTPAALIPMLTGHHEHELPNTIKYSSGSSFVDEVYPFIWNEFKNDLDYATYFGEDWPGWFIFLIIVLKHFSFF